MIKNDTNIKTLLFKFSTSWNFTFGSKQVCSSVLESSKLITYFKSNSDIVLSC